MREDSYAEKALFCRGDTQLLRLVEIEVGRVKYTSQACKVLGLIEQSYYRWRMENSGLEISHAKWLKSLEKENARQKSLAASLDNIADEWQHLIVCLSVQVRVHPREVL